MISDRHATKPEFKAGDVVRYIDGRPEMWTRLGAYPGGWVCAMPDNKLPEGIGVCGMPVEDEPCPIHFPNWNEATA